MVLLEREAQLAHHTTGRSAAMYLQSYGNPLVRALTVASEPDFEVLERSLATPRLLTPQAQLWIADKGAQARLEALLATGGPLRPLTASECSALCPALRPERLMGGALDTSACEIDVMALHHAYAHGLVARGGEIRSSTPVTSLQRSGSGWEVETPAERLGPTWSSTPPGPGWIWSQSWQGSSRWASDRSGAPSSPAP